MMTIFVRFLFLSIFCFFSFAVSSQEYTEGWFDFGLISLEVSDDADLDSSMVDMMRNNIESQLGMTIYFSGDRIAMDKIDVDGDTTHVVYDIEQKKVYEFKEVFGKHVFTIDNAPETIVTKEEIAALPKIDEKNPEAIELFGLNCLKYKMESEEGEAYIITTKDIKLADFLNLKHPTGDYGVSVRTIIDEPAAGMKLVMGMKLFSPIIDDRKVFSIDTTGIENVTVLRNDAREILMDESGKNEDD